MRCMPAGFGTGDGLGEPVEGDIVGEGFTGVHAASAATERPDADTSRKVRRSITMGASLRVVLRRVLRHHALSGPRHS